MQNGASRRHGAGAAASKFALPPGGEKLGKAKQGVGSHLAVSRATNYSTTIIVGGPCTVAQHNTLVQSLPYNLHNIGLVP